MVGLANSPFSEGLASWKIEGRGIGALITSRVAPGNKLEASEGNIRASCRELGSMKNGNHRARF